MDGRRRSLDFLEQAQTPLSLDALFDYVPDVYMFAKDREGRFVKCNRSFAHLLHAVSEEQVLGKRDADFFPRHLAENYTRDDNVVISTGVPMVDKVELVRNADGSVDWYNTTKIPVMNHLGTIIGVAGVTRDLKRMRSRDIRFLSLAPVVETILGNYAQRLSISSLAAKASLSISQLDRQFRRKFHTTPRKYIINVRINAACELLVSSDLPICDIALETGFYDQSHFTNQFVRYKGMPPSQYRRKFAATSA
jgi:PAS domain S-box-containing protein